MNKEDVFNILYGPEKIDIYHQFQEIESDIDDNDYLYNYFDDIKDMLDDDKSYIRLRGFRIICRLSRWDNDNKIEKIINKLLNVIDDDKPTIVRQCLANINYLLLYKPELSDLVVKKIEKINYNKYKESMSPLIKKDVENIIKNI